MPAVTVDNILALPRIDAPAPGAVDRPVRSLTTAPVGYEGEASPFAAPSPASIWPRSTPSSTWTRWVR